ncbi:MAG: alpha-galactosidase [Opitutales bacterium]
MIEHTFTIGPLRLTVAHLDSGGWFIARLVWQDHIITEGGAEQYAAGWEVNLNGVRYTPHSANVTAEPLQHSTVGEGIDVVMPHVLPGACKLRQILRLRPKFFSLHCEIENGSAEPLVIDRFNFAQLKLDPRFRNGLELYHDYASRRAPVLNCNFEIDDPGIVYAKSAESWGIAILNLAPGVTRRIATGDYTSVGYANSAAPFRWTLSRGETFTSDAATVIPWHGDAQSAVYQFVHHELRGGRFVPQPVTYCSWEPFNRDIDETRIREQAELAAGLGFEVFLVDDGWQDYAGDWHADSQRFPNGLEAVREHVEKLDMRLGLWIALTTVHSQSRASEHAQLLRDERGQPRTTAVFEGELAMACLASDYRKHIYGRLSDLVSRLNLRYLKVDLPVAMDVYFQPALRCFAEGHDHPPGADYTLRSYRAVQQIAADLREEFPDLIVDLTFELWGGWHMIDHALTACADSCWLSNLSDAEGTGAYGPGDARHLAASRAALIPPAHQVVGNLRCNGPHPAESVASAFASFPMLLGDLSALGSATVSELRRMIDWFKANDVTRANVRYLSILEVGCETPSSHRWSGFLRLSEQGRGIMGIFRNRSRTREAELTIATDFVEPCRWRATAYRSGDSRLVVLGEPWIERVASPHGFNLYQIEPCK